ncbi:MAG: glycoside hydrolase family 43 protein [Janthinobacterium lividum]
MLAPLLLLGLLAGGSGPGGRTTPTSGPASAATTFTNPLLPSGPDPWVVQKDGYYYYMATTGNNVTIRKTAKMSELGTAPVYTVWAPQPNSSNTRNVWAPEMHFLDGKWYIYYTAGPSNRGCCGGQRSWVLENASADPTAGTWTEKAQLASPTQDFWSIDMTVFELNGSRYALWSGQEANSDQQNIYISAMSNPWTLTGPRTLLTKPELGWELNGTPKVNEGPEILQHGGKTFLVYSASHCSTDDYALGMLTLTGTNPLAAGAWSKSQTPVFIKNPANRAYGPGHNGFFTSKDGSQNWFIYHANSNAGEGCGNPRNPRMQQFTWNPDGTPNFGVPVAIGMPLARPAGE